MGQIERCARTVPLLAALLLGGCAFPTTLERIAVDQNEVVAHTDDRLALLNILRAKDGRPLHFTSITRLSGNVEASAGAGLGTGFDIAGGDNGNIQSSLSAGVATNPNFDITIHDSQEFQRGIQTPIDEETITYYLRTGWRPEVLTYLLVERIDFVASGAVSLRRPDGSASRFKAGDIIATLENDPRDPAAAARFRRFVGCFALAGSQRPGNALPLKKLSEVATPGIADLALLDGSKLDLGKGLGPDGRQVTEGPDDWVVRRSAGGEAVSMARTAADPASCTTLSALLADGSNMEISAGIDSGITRLDPRVTKVVPVSIAGQPQPIDIAIDISFRSVNGVIYFLGEYVRASLGDGAGGVSPGMIYPIGGGAGAGGGGGAGREGQAEPLFLVERGRGGRHDLSATLNGATYHIPADRSRRSYQVIALVEQLFNLHKAAATGPQSTAVRIVN